MMKEHLKALCELPGVSGSEEQVRAYILSVLQASPVEKEITVDSLGNILCHLRGENRAAKKVMFAAHMDEVGFIVRGITDDGYLQFETVGGIDKSVLCGRRVRLGAQVGVIGCKAIHLCEKDEAEVLPEAKALLIDIGTNSREEAEKTVAIGDTAVFDTPFTEMQSLVMAKAVDDRAGCTLLLELAQKMPPYDITLAFTVQEEVGLRGAGVAAFSERPDIAVAIDGTTANDVADVPKEKWVCTVGSGAVVSFMDRATVYDPALYRQIREIADSLHLPNQTKTVIVGGNDAGAMQRAAGGARVAAVSLPCRYIHSPSSVVSLTDMENTVALLFALTKKLPQ